MSNITKQNRAFPVVWDLHLASLASLEVTHVHLISLQHKKELLSATIDKKLVVDFSPHFSHTKLLFLHTWPELKNVLSGD